jgi:hypothetical protein
MRGLLGQRSELIQLQKGARPLADVIANGSYSSTWGEEVRRILDLNPVQIKIGKKFVTKNEQAD